MSKLFSAWACDLCDKVYWTQTRADECFLDCRERAGFEVSEVEAWECAACHTLNEDGRSCRVCHADQPREAS